MIVEELGMNQETLILTKDLGMKKWYRNIPQNYSKLNKEMWQRICWSKLNLTQVY